MTDSMADLNSDRALVCKREHHSDAGGAIVWYVLLKDAHLLDCGYGGKAEQRAKDVAKAINAALARDMIQLADGRAAGCRND